tara:strand:+ start:33 stop:446 length:414 start_codon:yes stop_codon:yes gene_type:complete
MFFNKKSENKNDSLSKVAALLIYAAKIDENYSNIEEKIIKEAILKLGADEKKITKILNDAKKLEENSNQILDFTKEVKHMNYESKIKIIETLWQIIYSNNKVDMYEDNLMRRIAGLLYIDSKIMGDIKEKVRGDNSQ